jgi:hypothetical protein
MLSEEALAQIKQDGYTAEALAPYREASVLDLVRQLADAMTSDDANARTAAVGFLWRACLTGDDAKHYQRRADFDAAAVDAVVKFLAEKALTYATADEAYEGLAAIVSKYLPLMQPATVEFLCTEWLPAAGLQRQGVKSRQRGLAVLKALASTHGRTMGAGGDLVARGLLAAVDEERDPSNVMTAFTVNALLAPHFSAQTMQVVGEDLFDSLAVYFPILFTPPQGCPVTKADLREALHMALASPAYAEYALTFLCNKLASPANVTKTEALDVMRRCIQPLLNDHAAPAKRAAYLATLRQSYPETFVALRSEVLRLSAMGEHGDPELLQSVLRMLCDLTASVRHLHQEDLLGSLKPIVDAAVSTIEGGSPAGRAYATMLHAVASAAPSVCRTIFEYTVPLVCAIASEPSPKPNQVDGAAAIVAAVTAAAERCFAAGTPVPAPRAEALEAATDFIALLRRRAFDSATASLSVASGIETTSTLSVLGTLDSAWLAQEAVVDNYRELAQLSTTRHNEVGACAAKALANAMRVDRKFAPAVLKEEAARAAADPKALLQCAVAVAEIPDAEAQDLSLGLVLMLLDRTPDRQLRCDAWDQISATAAGVVEREKKVAAASTILRCHHTAPSLGIAVQALQAVLLGLSADDFGGLYPAFDDDDAAAAATSASVCRDLLAAAAPLSLSDSLRATIDFRGTADALVSRWVALAGDASHRRLLSLVVAHCTVAERHELGARLGDDADASMAAELLKGCAMRGDTELTKRFESMLYSRVGGQDPAAAEDASEALASVLSPPKPTEGVARMWEQRFFFCTVSALRELGSPAALRCLRRCVAVAQDLHVALAAKELTELALSQVGNAATRSDAAGILAVALAKAPEEVLPRLTAAGDRLVAIAQAGAEAEDMHTRMDCFRLLSDLASGARKYDKETLATFLRIRDAVAQQAKHALDDRKRLVRAAAAKCRHYWMLLDAAEG